LIERVSLIDLRFLTEANGFVGWFLMTQRRAALLIGAMSPEYSAWPSEAFFERQDRKRSL
jgi:hypothetical protein